MENVKFEGIEGTWYEIDRTWINGKEYILFESEQYGDERNCIATDSELNMVVLDCYNGLEDVRDYLDE